MFDAEFIVLLVITCAVERSTKLELILMVPSVSRTRAVNVVLNVGAMLIFRFPTVASPETVAVVVDIFEKLKFDVMSDLIIAVLLTVILLHVIESKVVPDEVPSLGNKPDISFSNYL